MRKSGHNSLGLIYNGQNNINNLSKTTIYLDDRTINTYVCGRSYYKHKSLQITYLYTYTFANNLSINTYLCK